jgi:translocator protein
MKLNYFVILLITAFVAYYASQFTNVGITSEWYLNLSKPLNYPPGWAFGLAWSIIYPLTALSVILFYNKAERSMKFTEVILLFLFNAFLNATWSYLFFAKQYLEGALIQLLFVNITVLALIIITWPQQVERRVLWFFKTNTQEKNAGHLKIASLLLVPYLVWGLYAMVLNYQIWQLNI